MAEEIQSEIRAGAAALGVSVDPGQAELLGSYATSMLKWNERVNLTAVTEPREVARKHFVDSLSLLRLPVFEVKGAELADVGSGAGFPGLVLAIMRPGLRVTLIDALGKRIAFLEAVITELGLENVKAVHQRAEEAGHDRRFRERFDLVTARAVAPMAVLAEYCLPLARVGGEFVGMKSRAVDEEIAAAGPALAVLGGEVTMVERFELPGGGEERALVRVGKHRPTPDAYPRRAGVPERNPIGGGMGVGLRD
ncbi:MAG: 16S rRNA (guanine(527)-N(7))-methyltransferase RsmG [Symbiobacteriia bacterium]